MILSDSSNISESIETASVNAQKMIRGANETLLQNFLNGSLILGTILFFLNLYNAFQQEDTFATIIVFAAYALVFLITFARMIPYTIRVGFLTIAYLLTGVISFYQSGMNANGLLYLLISVLVIALLEERGLWILQIGINTILVSIMSYLINTGIIEVGSSLVENNTLLYWISVIVNFTFLLILTAGPISQFMRTWHRQVEELNLQNDQLTRENLDLQARRTEFEKDFDRRRLRQVTARQISREISHQSDIDKLLTDTVDLIRTQLNYQHVAIFITDERGETASLVAATGEGSQALLERKYRIRVQEPGIINSVILHGESFLSNNLAEETRVNRSFIIPKAQAELTAPLRIGQKMLGALDVQAEQTDVFRDEDIEMLQTIADQLALVIDKATQIQALQEHVANLEESYRSYTRGAWTSHLASIKENLNYAFVNDTLSTEFEPFKISEEAMNNGEIVTAAPGDENNPDSDESIMAVPIVLRDQVLGVLNIKYKGKEIPRDLTALVSNASDRLALALENARLLEQIQQRADREHLVGEISSKLRSATDIDSILRTTAAELGKSLGIDEVRIQLRANENK
ncbi:MAG: GAF domain-containing protein [Anaerolineaceae bacterium]|nr:GAF domain-containing protein [Anaerolineaceae bacterium]